MDGIRACPTCSQPQRWCNSPLCFWPIPRGHWTHLTAASSEACPVLADRANPPQAVSN